MKRFLAFVKTTLIGGVVVVLPAWLAVLLVLKALGHMEIFVKPVSSHLPQSFAHPRIIGILVLIGLCFLVGALIQTAIGRKAERAAERAVLEKIPGYTVLRSLASRLSNHAETASFQPWRWKRHWFQPSSSNDIAATVARFSFHRCPHPWLELFIY